MKEFLLDFPVLKFIQIGDFLAYTHLNSKKGGWACEFLFCSAYFVSNYNKNIIKY